MNVIKRSNLLDYELELYRKWVYNAADSIDPENELDWKSLCIGWALGRSMTIRQAERFYEKALEEGIV